MTPTRSRRSVLLGTMSIPVAALFASMRAERGRAAEPVYKGYAADEIDAALDPKLTTPNWEEILKEYYKRSDEVRKTLTPQTYHYGSNERDVLDLYTDAGTRGGPAFVFFHGGGWRMMSKDPMGYAAPAFNAAGINYITPSYPLAPAASLSEIVTHCRQALEWVYRNSERLGIDPSRIVVGGASAGAHIAGCLAATDWASFGLPSELLKGAVLVSGLYDLAPLRFSQSRSYISLQPEDFERLSPLNHVQRMKCPLIVAWAEGDPPIHIDQGAELAARAKDLGLPCVPYVAVGWNHFDFPLALGESSSAFFRLCQERIFQSLTSGRVS